MNLKSLHDLNHKLQSSLRSENLDDVGDALWEMLLEVIQLQENRQQQWETEARKAPPHAG